MTIRIYLQALLMLLYLIVFAPGVSVAGLSGVSISPELSVDVGLRTDQLDWNIAGTSPISLSYVNVLSELTWGDVQTYQLRLRGGLDLAMESQPWFRPHFRGQFGYGRIYSGQNQDSDYDGDNRTLEFSRSNNAADRGDTLDLSFGVGQKISFLNDRLTLIPLVGYSYHAQNLKLLDGFQTIPADGPFAGLNSSYDTEWRGPWLGIELEWALSERLSFGWLTEYHRADYSAEANWNLRTEPVTGFAHPLSFEHGADGDGWVNEIGLEFLLSDQWSLNLSGTFERWQTEAGYALVFFADGSQVATRLNQVNWESTSIQVGLSCNF